MKLAMPELVLCDLDGTLVDSIGDLAHAVDAMMHHLALPVHGVDKIRQWVGNGAEKLVKRALADDMHQEPTAHLFEAGMPLFMQYYRQKNGQHSELYPGVREGLNWLKAQRCRLACVTNKPTDFTLPLLEQMQLNTDFELIICGDTLTHKKPHPLPLQHALDYFKVTPTNALMLGDSVNDVQAARAAKVPVVCVSYGYNHGESIQAARPEAIIDSLDELIELLG